MGFLKTLTLHRHATKIAAGFGTLRAQQFDSVLRAIDKRVEPQVLSGQRTLGGDADFALKAYQLVIATAFSIEHPYVSDTDFQEFAGHLNIAVSGADRQGVETFFLKFSEYQRQALKVGSEEAQAEFLAKVCIPVADYIVPESNPIAWTITAMLMPIFSINTQMVIADEFGDRPTVKSLQSEMDDARQQLTQRTPVSQEEPNVSPKMVPSGERSEPPLHNRMSNDEYAKMLERGQYYRENNFRSIGDWEDRMVKEFGEHVIEFLPHIWTILK